MDLSKIKYECKDHKIELICPACFMDSINKYKKMKTFLLKHKFSDVNDMLAAKEILEKIGEL